MHLFVVLDEHALENVRNLEFDADAEILTLSSLRASAEAIGVPVHVPSDADISHTAMADCEAFVREYRSAYRHRPEWASHIEPHINVAYYFFFRPLTWFVKKAIALSPDRITLVGGHPAVEMPVGYGIAILEQNRQIMVRVSWVLNPYLYRSLRGRFDVRFISERYDLMLVRRQLRRAAVFVAMTGGSIARQIREFERRRDTRPAVALVVVRSAAQVRYLRKIAGALNDRGVSIAVLAHHMLGSSESAVQRARTDLNDVPVVSMHDFGALWEQVVAAGRALWLALMLRVRPPPALKFETFAIDARQLAADLLAFTNFHGYARILERAVRRVSGGTGVVISSENQSNQAFCQRSVADKAGLKFGNIQTGVLEKIPYPVYSVGGTYMTLLPDQAEALNECAVANVGTCRYIGPLKYLGYLKPTVSLLPNPNDWRQVTYLTQPLEYEFAEQIIHCLRDWLSRNAPQARLVLRLHPRDLMERYRSMVGVEFSSSDTDLYDEIARSDLVVSRVSSALEESLYIGRPYIACLFSDFDRSFAKEANYLDASSGLVCHDTPELEARLEGWNDLATNFNRFRADYLETHAGVTDGELVDRLMATLSVTPTYQG